ncbi:MAG TPA: hypothetical protein VK766_01610, partial [Cytophagaceae bacterium]|nr:hypothetical protein [Cytophagaceae bacterium]
KHRGWQLFSCRYSDLVISPQALYGGSGNHIYEPASILSFELVLIKLVNANSPIEVYVDYPTITIGGPFVPCK